jgi:trk system potassium uptake protein TrkA/voltage-gated potassium channel
MGRLFGSPIRNLVAIIVFMLAIAALATAAYVAAGWPLPDALYMVVLTVYTVGYEEVRPIDTPLLRAVTESLIVLGCTGMILLTGALVQVLTFNQIQIFLGANRMKTEIDRLDGHIIVCGFGRIGMMLARELADAGASFLILERSEAKLEEARAQGFLCLAGDATDEAALVAAGVARARVLATVLPDDAANVFITLSARALNPGLQIIARGEAPTTESKLRQAGADKVVLPTHIGAERIAEMVLFPETARFIRGSERMRDFEKVLRDLGLDLEMVVAAERSTADGATIGELEQRARGALFVVQINHRDGRVVTRPPRETRIQAGDGLLLVCRGAGEVSSVFAAPAARPRAGRTTY